MNKFEFVRQEFLNAPQVAEDGTVTQTITIVYKRSDADEDEGVTTHNIDVTFTAEEMQPMEMAIAEAISKFMDGLNND